MPNETEGQSCSVPTSATAKADVLEPEQLAQMFHESYERLAPSFGYETRKASAKPWAEVPENNRKLMTAVCAEILAAKRGEGEANVKAKWIEFELQPKLNGRKTDLWMVLSKSAIRVYLGDVAWYGPWRQFSFFPNRGISSVFERTCLRDIADFCEQKTKEHRESKRGEKRV